MYKIKKVQKINVDSTPDKEFDIVMSEILVKIFKQEYKKHQDIEKAMENIISILPILNIRGVVLALNRLKDSTDISQDLLDEVNEKYIHYLI